MYIMFLNNIDFNFSIQANRSLTLEGQYAVQLSRVLLNLEEYRPFSTVDPFSSLKPYLLHILSCTLIIHLSPMIVIFKSILSIYCFPLNTYLYFLHELKYLFKLSVNLVVLSLYLFKSKMTEFFS